MPSRLVFCSSNSSVVLPGFDPCLCFLGFDYGYALFDAICLFSNLRLEYRLWLLDYSLCVCECVATDTWHAYYNLYTEIINLTSFLTTCKKIIKNGHCISTETLHTVITSHISLHLTIIHIHFSPQYWQSQHWQSILVLFIVCLTQPQSYKDVL